MRSVPDLSTKQDENRVQENEKGDLYPIRARSETKTGYRRMKRAICTQSKRKTRRKLGTGEEKGQSVPGKEKGGWKANSE